jgi:hypothetical protein
MLEGILLVVGIGKSIFIFTAYKDIYQYQHRGIYYDKGMKKKKEDYKEDILQ